MIDSNSIEEGPFGVDRSGGLPVRALVKLCFSGKYTEEATSTAMSSATAASSLTWARAIWSKWNGASTPATARPRWSSRRLVHQICKEAGAMAAVLKGRVDAVLLTGGMAYSERMVASLRDSLDWIAPIRIYPGEDELQALAEGVFRVLDGEEQAKRLGAEPAFAQEAV